MPYPQGNTRTASKTHTNTVFRDKAKHGNRAQKPWPIGKGSGPLKFPSKDSSGVSGKYEAKVPLSLDGSSLTKDAEYIYLTQQQVRTLMDDVLPTAFTTMHSRVACPLLHPKGILLHNRNGGPFAFKINN